MAARAAARAMKRIEQRQRPLLPDRPGHHLHRMPGGTACSCGEDAQEACYVDAGEDPGWWDAQRCAVCGRPGVVQEGIRPAT
jgi:hypothetical protein